MPLLTRREVLGTLGACAAWPALAQTPGAGAPPLPSDFGRLKRVLVHSITANDELIDATGEEILPYADADIDAAVRQQASLIELLRAADVDVVELAVALDEAIDATRRSGVFTAWVEAAFPRLARDPQRVTAATLLGRDADTHFRLGADGTYRHFVDDSTATMFTRDSGFMSPQGFVICNSASPRRFRENVLMRFVYEYSPLLRDYPIAFDAVEEGVILEGGDAQVVDERTLFLGVGNRTDPRAAPALARRLNMDVLAVQTIEREFLRRGDRIRGGEIDELRLLFLHLDTYFTHVGPRHALTLPYLLEMERTETSPLARFVRGARAETLMSEEAATAALEMLDGLGRVKLYRRGSGDVEDVGEIKLVDYARKLGYRITFTGGAQPAGDEEGFRHFMDVTYPEHRRQATNVVQAEPGAVIAYSGAPATRSALEADGVEVETFEARELWAWDGGPHCLTQPLERA